MEQMGRVKTRLLDSEAIRRCQVKGNRVACAEQVLPVIQESGHDPEML